MKKDDEDVNVTKCVIISHGTRSTSLERDTHGKQKREYQKTLVWEEFGVS